ncbi:Reverse transcriptase domain [Trinorchestia longiramus]|nr:Reverse transcriptase domain [Trinorchestia longiramus]
MGNDFLLDVINSPAEKSVPMSTGRTGISRATPWTQSKFLPIDPGSPHYGPRAESGPRRQFTRPVDVELTPVCLLSCIGKLIERMIQRILVYWVETNNLLLGEQGGFRRGKSTMDSLLIAKDFIANTFSRKQICISIYMDFDGAYDSVWLEGIIYKLIASGLKKTYVKWVKNYLTGRTVSVSLGPVQPEGVPITWGLPLGAVLSPLLFNSMLSDLPVADGVQLIIHADDITILSKGNSLTEVRTCLQRYLDTLATWFKKWKLIVNPAKCSQQIFTKKHSIADAILRLNNSVVRNTTY